jgi:vacuolar protein sorting-associated protein 45
MDLVQACTTYVDRMCAVAGGPSTPKSLILDRPCLAALSSIVSQTQLDARHILLTETLEVLSDPQTSRFQRMDKATYLTAVVLVSPTLEAARQVALLVRQERYARVHVFFTESAPDDVLKALRTNSGPRVDTTICQVSEVFLSFVVYGPRLFVAPCVDAVLLALRAHPAAIHFLASSRAAQTHARQLAQRVQTSGDLFRFGAGAGTRILVLDRHIDLVTPLLTPWTYASMLYAHLPVRTPEQVCTTPDGAEWSVQVAHDALLARWQYLDYGALIKAYRDELALLQQQQQEKPPNGLASVAVLSADQMRVRLLRHASQASHHASMKKHGELLDALQATVKRRSLLVLSELEQALVSSWEGVDIRACVGCAAVKCVADTTR